ncbi:sensor histidine kinase [Psychromonas sp. CNPT3]|nr:sensor histidine kinase [Psychromonas sp. CNPT3]
MRLLTYILLSCTALALILTLIQLSWNVKEDIEHVKRNLTHIHPVVLKPLATNLWSLNHTKIENQLKAMISLSDMQYVRVSEFDKNGNEILVNEQGLFKKDFAISETFDLIYKNKAIGTLFVATSLDSVYSHLIKRSIILLFFQMIKTMLVSFCVLFIIYYFVIRHVNKLAHYTHTLQLHEANSDLVLDGKAKKSTDKNNELDDLVNFFNKLRSRIFEELTKKEAAIIALQQERDLSKSIINASNSVICYLNPNFSIESINPAAVILTGYSQEELYKKNWLSIFSLPKQHISLLKKLTRNEPIQNLEIKMQDQLGETNTLLWTFSAIYEGMDIKYLIGFGHDITAQKHVESKIQRLNDELEEKVEFRTAALTESHKKITKTLTQLRNTQQTLVESEKMASLGELVAGIAHEINTPVGISVTAASFLADEVNDFQNKFNDKTLSRSYVQKLMPRLNESCLLLNSNLKRAADLISSFKQVAVDQSSEAYYLFNLSENIEQVVLSLKHKIKQKQSNIYIECPDDLSIFSVPGSFIQIYANLIINSLEHGFDDWQADRNIYIDISLKANRLHIDYRDTGQGIPAEIAQRVFDPFVTTKRGSGGSGLGTHIIYNIVTQLLHGDIQLLESEQGVHFHISMPHQTQAIS